MNIQSFFLLLCLVLGTGACTALRTGQSRADADQRVQLTVNSLHARQVQETSPLEKGDELTLVYAIHAYDENGRLLSVNNGFWGTRTIEQDALILAEEFDKIGVHIPEAGNVIVAFTLIEIDDIRGERKIAKVRPHTNSERYPKALRASRFEDDQNLPPMELIARSLRIAGYNHFVTRHMNLSINDELGSTRQTYDAATLKKIRNGTAAKETYEMDGRQVNENYNYVLKYNVAVTPASRPSGARSGGS
jgi:hypothetical protein